MEFDIGNLFIGELFITSKSRTLHFSNSLDADDHGHTPDVPSQICDSTPIEYCTHTRYADDDKPIKKSHKPKGLPKKENEAEMEKKLRAEWSCVVKENQKLLE